MENWVDLQSLQIHPPGMIMAAISNIFSRKRLTLRQQDARIGWLLVIP